MEIGNTDLIELVQKPIISQKLQEISNKIDEDTNNALLMPCTEETRKEVKQVRADLNKEFQELEAKRKEIKAQISKPYDDFMQKIYEPLISSKFKNADIKLKEKIDNVENELKQEKREEIVRYFNDYAKSLEIDFLDFSKSGINILLSKSEKGLKTECKDYIDRVKQDIDYINTQDNKEELMVEYKNCNYDLRQALSLIEIKKKQIEIEKQRQEEKQKINEKQEEIQDEVVEIVNEYQEEPQNKEDLLTCTFTIQATKEQLRAVKQFLIDNKIQYK